MRKVYSTINKNIKEIFNLIWSFKWYVGAYLVYYVVFDFAAFFDPPAENDPILSYEYERGAWNYINQKVYIESMKLYLVIDSLIFLIGTSNMRNHPLLAKLIFLFPWLFMLFGAIIIGIKWLLGFNI